LKRFRHAKKVLDVTYLHLHDENVSVSNDYRYALWSSQLKRFRHVKKVFDVTYLDLHEENVSV